jgi:hypothetical protein
MYPIPASLVDNFDGELPDDDGHIIVKISNAYISEYENSNPPELVLSDDSELSLVDSSNYRRRLATPLGTKEVLVLRVRTNDASLSLDSATLRQRIFEGPILNVKQLYKDCSHGKLNLVQADHPKVQNGVLDVPINQNVNGANINQSFLNTITSTAQSLLGGTSLNTFDHVIFCIPPGSSGVLGVTTPWIGFGYYNHWQTVFNNDICGSLSTVVHEMGHNYGLSHSGEKRSNDGSFDEYGDQSGMMGYSYASAGAPQMCFNGAKHVRFNRMCSW